MLKALTLVIFVKHAMKFISILFSHEYLRNQESSETVLCRITTIAYNSLIEHYFGWKRVYETNLSIEVSVNFFSISFESFQAHLIELYLPKNTHTRYGSMNKIMWWIPNEYCIWVPRNIGLPVCVFIHFNVFSCYHIKLVHINIRIITLI